MKIIVTKFEIDLDNSRIHIIANINEVGDAKKKYENVNFSYIAIDSEDTYISKHPSETPIFKYDILKEVGAHERIINLYIPFSKILANITDNILIIYLETHGIPLNDYCDSSDTSNILIAVNFYKFKEQLIASLGELCNKCETPNNFINAFLRLKALETSVSLKDTDSAVDLFKTFKYNKSINFIASNKCGCNG